jgi:hypothetical protein
MAKAVAAAAALASWASAACCLVVKPDGAALRSLAGEAEGDGTTGMHAEEVPVRRRLADPWPVEAPPAAEEVA